MGTLYALLAAVFYALNAPLSKRLLLSVPPIFMASLLYAGAAIGVAIIYAFRYKSENKAARFTKSDFPYIVAMIVLDALAPVFLMVGIRFTTASSASLLGNFEIVATALIAFAIAGEHISKKLFTAITLITVASVILSVDNTSDITFSKGSLFVLLAAICWGFENNCTKSISSKSTYQIVILKGTFSAALSFSASLLMRERFPTLKSAVLALSLGFVAYGLSIFCYVRAQRFIGAAKTASFYALSPFIAVFLSLAINSDALNSKFLIALFIMATGVVFVTLDTISKK